MKKYRMTEAVVAFFCSFLELNTVKGKVRSLLRTGGLKRLVFIGFPFSEDNSSHFWFQGNGLDYYVFYPKRIYPDRPLLDALTQGRFLEEGDVLIVNQDVPEAIAAASRAVGWSPEIFSELENTCWPFGGTVAGKEEALDWLIASLRCRHEVPGAEKPPSRIRIVSVEI